MTNRADAKHTYNNGQVYRPALGRRAPYQSIQQHRPTIHSIIHGTPTKREFVAAVEQELKIRFYTRNTIKNYLSYLRVFLQWFGNLPHRVTRRDVRDYLELIVDSGASASHLAGTLSAIRTAFDKFCARDVTLGIATPRKPKKQPVVLSKAEVDLVIQAAPRRDIKLAIGLLYAAGLRNSELCGLRIRDFDFDRNVIRVVQGKGRTDRLVSLPSSIFEVLQNSCRMRDGDEYLFGSFDYRSSRHISPRTLQRWVEVTVELAGIKKQVTPHSFRHAFATHLLESGTDIRFIQKLLGHKRLETTTIYTRLAKLDVAKLRSPLDSLSQVDRTKEPSTLMPVGTLKFDFRVLGSQQIAVDVEVCGSSNVQLEGIAIRERQDGVLSVSFPSQEVWVQAVARLPEAQRLRILSPEFLGRIHVAVLRKFIAWRESKPD